MFHEGLGCRKDFSIDKFEISSGCEGQKCQMSILNLKLCQTWRDRQIVKQGSRLLGWPSFIFHISSLIRWMCFPAWLQRNSKCLTLQLVLERVLCHDSWCIDSAKEIQRDPKRSKEHKKGEGCRGLRVNTKRERQEISSRKHQEGHENGRENSSTSCSTAVCF
jgi:hypothetical protein